MRDRLTRRDFLFYGGATLAGVTLGELGRRRLARADERAGAWRDRGVESWATSVCRECPAACGVRARLIDGVPVKLEGNPLCPIARGHLCAKGQAAIESYFDPDRLVGPARRVGKRGEQRWEPIAWPAAVALIATHLRRLAGTRDAMLAVSADERGPLADAWTRFWDAAGARVTWMPAATADRLRPNFASMTGATGDPLFDIEHASYVLSFGAPIVEDWLMSPVWAQRSYGRFRRSASRARGRLVQIDCRRSLTARKADEWLGVPADQQIFLAYGIAAVLLRENRMDGAFLDQFTGNLPVFERELNARYPPDSVATATAVPVVTVLRLARELTASPQPLVVVAADAHPALIDAVFALNALIGAIDRPGGIFASAPAPTGERQSATTALLDVASGRLKPRLVAFRDPSALRSVSTPANLAVALDAADLVVSFSPYLDEAAEMADLLMPLHTPLERWHAFVPAPVVAAEAMALSRPAVGARLETRDEAELLRTAADAVGGDLAKACASWRTSEELVVAELDRLWHARRGGPYTTTYETEWLHQLERGGWWVEPAADREEFFSVSLGAGGWLDPFFEPGDIRESLRQRGGLRFAMPVVVPAVGPARPGAGALAPVSFAEDQAASLDADPPERFPLHLVPFTPAVLNGAGSPNQPVLFELLGQPESAPWRVWAELHPETAQRFGIAHGATIDVSSPQGSIEVLALLVDGMPRDALALAFVPAVTGGGRWARLMKDDVRMLLGREEGAARCAVRVVRG